MARRKHSFVNASYYHVFNRGVEKRRVFQKERDYERFTKALLHYQFKNGKLSRRKVKISQNDSQKFVEIIAYCLMPNHFHLLLKQVSDEGISVFMNRLANSYTKYFNTKYDRVGALFQGAFKSVGVETDEQLLHLSRYIHLNPVVAELVNANDLEEYQWSSYNQYVTEDLGGFISPEIILTNFSSIEAYKQFLLDQVDYAKELDSVKHLSLE